MAKREELVLRKMETEITAAVMKNYQALCADTTMDARAKVMFKDAILSHLTRGSVPPPKVQIDLDNKILLDELLIGRFNAVFIITEHACGHEKILYDALLGSIPPEEKEAFIESMYAACHPGEKLSSRDRKDFKAGKRVGKQAEVRARQKSRNRTPLP